MTDHQVVQVKLAGEVQVNHGWHIGTGAGRAVVGAADRLLVAYQVNGVDRGLGAHRGNAHHRYRPVLAAHIIGGLDRLGGAENLKGIVGAAPAGKLSHLSHRVPVGGVDRVGSAKLHGELQLAFPNVHRDNLARIEQLGAHNHIQAHAPAAHYRNRAARLNVGAEHGGAHSGGDAAADHRRLVHRQLSGGGNTAGLGNHGVLGKAGHLTHVVKVLAVFVEAGSAVQHKRAGRHVQVADVGVALQAGLAAAASRDKGEYYLISGFG